MAAKSGDIETGATARLRRGARADWARAPAPSLRRGAVRYSGRVRFFNTSGPVDPTRHYCLAPLARLDLDAVRRLVWQDRYFVLHAPRQTGKTSALLALRDLLNREGEFRCVYANLEVGQAARENVEQAMKAMLGQLARRARITLGDASIKREWSGLLAAEGPHGALYEALTIWAEADPKPLILLLDEVDSLVGDSLISVLRQIRGGYDQRPGSFPSSVVLCGVRDVRDYRIHSSSEKVVITGGSAFNIKARSLRLGDFDEEEVRALLGQHTEETGQAFTEGALSAVWEQTRGQPWLVNALADEVTSRKRDPALPIGSEDVMAAREALIRRRDTHLDQLADKLREGRVRGVVEPLLAGASAFDQIPDDDLQYVRDLGLIASTAPVRIANPIYREVIPRTLTWTLEERLPQEAAWYTREDGSLDVDALLGAFQQFFRENAEHWVERFDYREAGPQLLLQAFLHRVVNSGGRIEREYGLGRGRVDLVVIWPSNGAEEKTVVECKVVRGGVERTIREGVRQTRAYMDRAGSGAGHLVVFDRREGRSWEERIFRREEEAGGAVVTVWGM